MEKQFIPFELAVKLKELGFECEYSFKEYDTSGFLQHTGLLEAYELPHVDAPLWGQAFDWFRVKQNIVGSVDGGCEQNFFFFSTTKLGEESFFSTDFKSYEEARQACLEKLIENVEHENFE